MTDEGIDTEPREREKSNFLERLADRGLTWIFGEVRVPQDDQFQRRLTIVIWIGIVCWPAIVGTILTRALLEETLSSGVALGLQIATDVLGAAILVSWLVIPTIWYVRYGSRFGRPRRPDDDARF